VADRVNITIWKGTTMDSTNRKYSALLTTPFTRVMYQAHMEQHTRIRATEVRVMTRVYPKAWGKPWDWMALV